MECVCEVGTDLSTQTVTWRQVYLLLHGEPKHLDEEDVEENETICFRGNSMSSKDYETQKHQQN
jgi:hypothetical protein